MFCRSCGSEIEDNSLFCVNCGTKVEAGQSQPAQPTQQPQNQNQYWTQGQQWVPPNEANPYANQYKPAKPPVRHYAPGSFADMFHSQARSVLFLVTIILSSSYFFLSLLSGIVEGNVMSILSTFITAGLTCTAIWLIFASARRPKLPELSVTSMLLVKIHIIINIVLVSLVVLMLLILSFAMFAGAGFVDDILYEAGLYDRGLYGLYGYGDYASGAMVGIGVLVLLATLIYSGVYYPYIISFLKVTNSINDGLKYNNITKIEGVKLYTVLTYILVGLGFVGSLILLAVISSVGFMSVSPLTFIITLINYAAMIMYVIMLNKLNNEIKMKSIPR